MPLAEKALISRIPRTVGPARGLVRGIGDDCAVLKILPGHEALVTTDFTLEGVHFRREWHPPEIVGRRCLTRGLSDIAAMGGTPIAAFLSLAVPPKLPQTWIDRFLRGLLDAARESETVLAGGDTAQSPAGILADIIVLGSVPRGQAILRSGAKPGDSIFVTGTLGGAAAALSDFFAGKRPRPQDYPRHFAPVARIEVARILREKRIASSMIDLSDGLSTDLGHICDESKVGAEIVATAIPPAQAGRKTAAVDLRTALHGGEDYELLFTASPRKCVPTRIAHVPVTRIGRITRQKRVVLIGENDSRNELRPQGWEHFAKNHALKSGR